MIDCQKRIKLFDKLLNGKIISKEYIIKWILLLYPLILLSCSENNENNLDQKEVLCFDIFDGKWSFNFSFLPYNFIYQSNQDECFLSFSYSDGTSFYGQIEKDHWNGLMELENSKLLIDAKFIGNPSCYFSGSVREIINEESFFLGNIIGIGCEYFASESCRE